MKALKYLPLLILFLWQQTDLCLIFVHSELSEPEINWFWHLHSITAQKLSSLHRIKFIFPTVHKYEYSHPSLASLLAGPMSKNKTFARVICLCQSSISPLLGIKFWSFYLLNKHIFMCGAEAQISICVSFLWSTSILYRLIKQRKLTSGLQQILLESNSLKITQRYKQNQNPLTTGETGICTRRKQDS